MLCKDILFISERNIVRQDSFIIFLFMKWNKGEGEKKEIFVTLQRKRSIRFFSSLYQKITLWNSQPLLYFVVSRNTSLFILYKFPLINNFRVASLDDIFLVRMDKWRTGERLYFQWSSVTIKFVRLNNLARTEKIIKKKK